MTNVTTKNLTVDKKEVYYKDLEVGTFFTTKYHATQIFLKGRKAGILIHDEDPKSNDGFVSGDSVESIRFMLVIPLVNLELRYTL